MVSRRGNSKMPEGHRCLVNDVEWFLGGSASDNEDDESMARRLQEEEWTGRGGRRTCYRQKQPQLPPVRHIIEASSKRLRGSVSVRMYECTWPHEPMCMVQGLEEDACHDGCPCF